MSNKKLIIILSVDKAYEMWLASPSCYSNHYLMSVSNNGTIGSQNYGAFSTGLRPIVCLKSDVVLEKVNDDYIIK